jgi:hypothetical protein
MLEGLEVIPKLAVEHPEKDSHTNERQIVCHETRADYG